MSAPKLLYSLGNGASTTTSTSTGSTDTSIPLTSTTNFQAAPTPGEGMALVAEGQSDEEIAYSTGLLGSSLTTPLVNRGLEGGSAQAHASAVSVKGILTAGMWNNLITAMKNVVSQSTGALDTTKVVDLSTAQTFTGAKTFTTGLLKAVDVTSGAGVSTFPTSTGTLRQLASRVLSATTYTTNTGTSLNCDTQDMFIITAQAGALKFNNPSGTPTDGQTLIITVASSTTAARALTWDTAFGATTTALPTTTAATTVTLSIGFIWSASKSLWQCLAVA